MDKSANDVLSQLLSDAGIEYSAAAVRDIIKGVAASPGSDGAIGPADSWHQLVGLDISSALAGALTSELEIALKIDDGLGDGSNPSKARLADLRGELKAQSLDGFIIPLADEHQGEYVPKNAQRLAWLTGFTGSAGLAIVLKKKAAIFVDGRYTLQASEQVDEDQFEINHLIDQPADTWISENLKNEAVLGFDPWLHTSDGVVRLRKACAKVGAKLSPVDANPVDAVWHNQPHPPLTPVTLLGSDLTGRASIEKRQNTALALQSEGLAACVLTAPDSIAWAANIRGGDVPYTPFSLSFAILHADCKLAIYGDLRKYPSSSIKDLEQDISLHPREDFLPALHNLGAQKSKIGVDLSSAAEIITKTLTDAGASLQRLTDPCQLPKAKKNAVELDGMKQAHVRDGIALTRFLAWLDETAPGGDQTEISVADQLEAFRREGDKIQGLSFPTISGSGPNGAIVHYRVTPESNRKLDQNSLYLVDSGAQYLDGTTDVTRTIAIGTPSAEMKDRFTRVLKGHIALASAVFPMGTSGSQLDVLARAALWQIGLDYDHGTGHGVGSYLGVHEGPHRISKIGNRIALEPGMIVSNEPGYYKTGEYGIRIESLLAVVVPPQPETTEAMGAKPLLGFETLTLAPIDLRLIEKALLTRQEMDWLNGYHHRVRTTLGPLLDKKTQKWLELKCVDIN
ncbi:MAG: aminopeptidase P family protein [Rhodospirillaceae bacterium]|jgi:Xaa-Pro aminopeptidase|nr:aminopeptidase P family protein [Rhodospirillaceae bacterium]MBT4589970.1 aminopeptidase P family protein [Rhodospirillaceae bacterium]MBT4938741.1 aminopeptidase P family protein [Rhodospirillaceae bacterium]MBT5938573.1 aminopeptidase P family protein [Rhodospirillaceae bacterium]MBT7265317.1 aminopeptidase P family protein [Rhodospirillaceae bacterium]